MVQENSADESLKPALQSTKGTAVWVPSRFAALLNVLIGFLLLIVAPLAMYTTKSHFNGPVLAVNTVFALIIIVFGIFDYRAQLSKIRNLWKKLPTVMIVLGFILFFFYSEFYANRLYLRQRGCRPNWHKRFYRRCQVNDFLFVHD